MNDKKTKMIVIIVLAIIIVPIAWNKISTFVNGIMMAQAMKAPTKVETAVVQEMDINEKADYVGRIQAEKEIKIVSRINGWLKEKYYKDGDFVKKGQLLFLIEPDEYIIAVKNAEAALRRAQATYNNAAVEMKRAKELVKGDYVSRSYYDEAYATFATSKATVDAARADLAQKRLDLSYTRICAPFDGKIGKLYIDEGNYVTAQTGELASLMTIDPIYATFNVKSEELIKYKRVKKASSFPDVTITLKLADGSIYNEPGKLDFLDNHIDPDLGTIMLRTTFQNSHKILIPNDFVRVIMTANFKTKVSLVPQDAVLENVNSKYVWIIDENGCAKQKNIEVRGQYDKYWILKDGLKVGDVIIATNIQNLREGSKVQIVEQTKKEEAETQTAINKTAKNMGFKKQSHDLKKTDVKQDIKDNSEDFAE